MTCTVIGQAILNDADKYRLRLADIMAQSLLLTTGPHPGLMHHVEKRTNGIIVFREALVRHHSMLFKVTQLQARPVL